jgi:hypothetical protein
MGLAGMALALLGCGSFRQVLPDFPASSGRANRIAQLGQLLDYFSEMLCPTTALYRETDRKAPNRELGFRSAT